MPEGSLVRLPDPELFLDLDAVEETVEAEPFDLSALILGLTIGEQTQADIRLPKLPERFYRSGQGLHGLLPDDGEAVVQLDYGG